MSERARPWLLYALITTLFFGLWGALIEVPEKAGFPATLGYAVWALTMIPCAAVALGFAGWALEWDARAVLLGLAVGLLGAGGQIILFLALRKAPAYIVFPIVSLYPMLTVVLSTVLLRERASKRAWTGIVLAILALPLLSFQPPENAGPVGYSWLIAPLAVFVAWGVQVYLMKFANRSMTAESLFFYMAAGAVLLIPAAWRLTDFSQPINWGWQGPWLAAAIQVLNSIGALCLVYALRYGKAIIVVPMTALAPVLTILLSLALYRVVPHPVLIAGIVLASVAIYLLAE